MTELSQDIQELLVIGWREWVALPELGIPKIKAKIDTGARTSVLHAFRVETFEENGIKKVKFDIHPRRRSKKKIISCVANLEGIRWVTDSGGHRERRCVIKTPLMIGPRSWPIEITLTNRDDMLFRMLLGRTALRNQLIVNPQLSYSLGKIR